jgi:hypothetical protein
MSFDEVICYVPTCDDCGPACWDALDDGPPHFFGSNVMAAQILADQHGWEIERFADGTIRMLCARCARKRECDTNGCQWYVPAVDHVAPGDRPVEMCSNCSKVRRDYEPLEKPPAGHPDLKPVDLTAGDLAVLDAYEAEFTEARKEH